MGRALILALAATVFGFALVGACNSVEEPDVTRTSEGVLRLGSVEAVDTVRRAVDPKGRPLVIEGIRGSVHLRGDSTSTARFSFRRQGRGRTPKEAREVLDGISVTESGTEESYTFSLAADEPDYAAVDVTGSIGMDDAVRIDRRTGPVAVAGVGGGLTVRHQFGGVAVSGAAARVDVDIASGDVRVDFVSMPPSGPIRLHTDNGDLTVGLPHEASAHIDARTQVGRIRTRGVSLTPEEFGPVNAGAGYRARLGDGGPTVELRTENGTITVQRSDSMWTASDWGPSRVDTTSVSLSDTTVVPTPSSDSARPGSAAIDTVTY